MIRNVKRTWFEVWGTEEAQNRFLKALLVFFIALCCTESIALVILALRKPPVVAVSATESRVLTISPPKAELLENEVKRSVIGYMTAHYNWEWTKIDDAFREASRFVHPDFTKKFLAANEAQTRVAKEKKVSQRFYISESKFDLKAKAVTVSGDRILVVEGLRATNPLVVQVEYDFGPRIETNPEGVYIVGEKLVSASEGGAR